MTKRMMDQAAPVRPGEALDHDALTAYLHDLLETTDPISVRQFPSGFSNLTYLISVGQQEWVLRKPPHGAQVKGGHDMGREFTILHHLHPTYPKAPRPLAYCDDPSVLGTPFYLMERVQGHILRAQMPDDQIPPPQQMRETAQALIQTLAELHQVDLNDAGLQHLGRPEGYVLRQIEGWTKRYHKARTDPIDSIEQTASWLADNRPASTGATLIHNDYKYDNVVLDPQHPTRIIAVLDWEMATVGDPLMDLGTTLGYWVEPGDPPAMQALALSPTMLPGNPTRAEIIQWYESYSGHPITTPVFYYAYGLFKIAVIVQQIYKRYTLGLTRDPRFKNLIHAVRACGDMALQAIAREHV